MKKLFINTALFAATALSFGAASAQTASVGRDAPVARTIMANTPLCSWYAHGETNLEWTVVTKEVSDQWEAAVNSIAEDYKLSQEEASRKLAQMCRQQLAQK